MRSGTTEVVTAAAGRRLGHDEREVRADRAKVVAASGGATSTRILTLSAAILAISTPILRAAPTPDPIEFFESRIRPILAQECYECHSEATKTRGGLLLDSRPGWQKGGDSGALLKPGQPEASLLLQAIGHEIADLKMPKNGARLDERILADFRDWIAMGAPDPRDTPPSSEELRNDTDWSAVSARRAQWWSFRPIAKPEVPEVPEVPGAEHPIDRFVHARLASEGLPPSPPADARTLVRRLSFNLLGLPPDSMHAASTGNGESIRPASVRGSRFSQVEWSREVDALLADPGFGEKWARHWMDWTRYADSHGSEGDPAIPHAWRYRDYLVRALNDDVPLDQLVVEHFAGDLLDEPRTNAELGLNESALGPGHLRMVFHGFSPTDALDERVRFTDDQINSATKAFLGLTVSCARCHDHKFDAISQADYYALYGIFTATLPATIAVDAPGVLEIHRDELAALKGEIREGLAAHWLATLPGETAAWEALVKATRDDAGAVPALLRDLAGKTGRPDSFALAWAEAAKKVGESKAAGRAFAESAVRRWDLGDPAQAADWSRYGEGLSEESPASPGEFVIGPDGPVVARVLPAGTYSHLLSTRHRAVLASAPFDLDGEFDLYLRVAGENSSARYAVQHYPRRGTIFPVTSLDGGRWRWAAHDLAYWKGDRLHLELATAGDAPILVKDGDRSWFGLREAVLVPKGRPAPPDGRDEALAALLRPDHAAPADLATVLTRFQENLHSLLSDWGKGNSLTNPQSLLFDEILAAGWLPNAAESLPAPLAGRVSRYRALESSLPLPTRAPGVWERPGADHALYVRGDHNQPADPVPRRFLEAIDATPYQTSGTGRLEFARDLVAEKNPFTARVLVNRVWHHLFGSGLVATPDNFGRLGEEPSHPELLDYLAHRFRNELGWSLKALVREIVLSETWRQAGGPSPEALAQDPDNRLLSSYPLRRLEAEAIRDSLLAVAGRLDRTAHGPPATGATPRRSLYLRVKRNNLDPLLTTFDFPTPASTVGRRDITNVPAQSLTLLNDPFLIEQAQHWAGRVLAARQGADDGERIHAFFESGLNRPPTESELAGAREFLATIDDEHHAQARRFSAVATERGQVESGIAALLDPVRTRLESERAAAFAGEKGRAVEVIVRPDLRPVLHWDFQEGGRDRVADFPLTLHGSARIEDGALVVDGRGWAASGPLPFALAAKTLEAVVQLGTLEQAGGGVLSVQKDNGGVFDSLVFAERRKHEWLAGSDRFARTLDFGAPRETEAASRPVHLVLTYAANGTIRGYRDGEPLGEAIRKAALQTYEASKGQVLLGLRHGTAASGNRSLRGRILEARLYDRELTESEVHAASAGGPAPVTRADLEAALGESGVAAWQRLEAKLAEQQAELAELETHGANLDPEQRRWRDFAHAMFNLKEFVYLR